MIQPAAKQSRYEPAEVEAIVRKWFQSYSDKDFETHNNLIHPDVVVVYPEMRFASPDLVAGKSYLVKTLEHDEDNFLDLRQTITNLWVVGDTAFVEGFFSGNKIGGTLANDAGDQAEMHLTFLDRIDIEDGMIKLVYCYYDTALLYQIQLGLEGPSKEKPITDWMVAMAAKKRPAAA